jgi:outer membrane receptor protein involved in Fe transport
VDRSRDRSGCRLEPLGISGQNNRRSTNQAAPAPLFNQTTASFDAQMNSRPAALDGKWTVTLGVNNLLNQDPPFCFSCELNSFDGSAYDVEGMFLYGRVVARFGNK